MDMQSGPRVTKNIEKKNKKKSASDKSLKVVYISSPMKVKTSASRFRSIVQELTGRYSDVSQLMEAHGGSDFLDIDLDDRVLPSSSSGERVSPSVSTVDTQERSPTSSGSLFMEPMDNVFSSQIEEEFAGIFSSNLFYDSSHLDDVLGSYDEL